MIAHAAAYEYAQVEDMLELAKSRGEDPFIFLLDNIEDPHNLEQSSVRQIWPGLTESSFPKEEQLALPLPWQKPLQGH